MSVFDKRVAFKPFEYPQVIPFKDAINKSFWLVSEWNFVSDTQDFHTRLDDREREVLRRAILAISQIEVSVKKFWSKLGDRFPKAEFDQVGITFGESEVRHADAYSHLLQVLGLNAEFEKLVDNPVIKGRVDYLTKHIKTPDDMKDEAERKKFMTTLTLFSLFVENVSLFSQFLIIQSFNKHKNVLKDIDNVIQATRKEETIHALFGVELIKIIRKEFPDWFDTAFYVTIKNACRKAFHAEVKIIDWIFENGDLHHINKAEVTEFLKHRFNESMKMLGYFDVFEVDRELLESVRWFEEETHADTHSDFFHKKPVTYTKHAQSFQADDLF